MRYELARVTAGITSRQADFWRSKGYITATNEGSGTISEITVAEAHTLLRMATLVRAGMKAADASRIAHESAGANSITVNKAFIILFDPQPTEATS